MFYLVLYTLLSLLPGTLSRRYSLIRDYNASNFFDEFTFFTGQDPTGGFVTYVPFDNASATGLIHNSTGIVYLGVDHSNVYSAGGPGRPSVRLESRLTFTEGLFVLDLSHLPVGCGTWPAFWTVGLGDWPTDGEIDIIEGVNDAKGNDAALHATGECLVSSDVVQKSTWRSTNCNINHDGNLGCGVKFTEAGTYGNKFNLNGGGIYAMEWTNSAIKIWFFPPTLAPESLTSMSLDSSPDPSTYGIPSAEFSGPCSNSFPEKFFNHTIVIDTTFCGGWAGTRFGKDAGSICLGAEAASPEDSCKAFVGEHPEAFEEAYWAINSLRVWQSVTSFEPEVAEVSVSTNLLTLAEDAQELSSMVQAPNSDNVIDNVEEAIPFLSNTESLAISSFILTPSPNPLSVTSDTLPAVPLDQPTSVTLRPVVPLDPLLQLLEAMLQAALVVSIVDRGDIKQSVSSILKGFFDDSIDALLDRLMLVTPKEAPEPDIPATPELLVGLEPPVALEILTGPEMQPALEFSHKFKRCLQKRESVADCDPEPKSPPIHEGPHIPVATSLYDQPFDPDLSFEDYKKLLGKHPSRRRDAKLTFARKAVILYLQLLGDGVIRDNVTSLAEIVDLFGLLQADITEIISSPLFQWLLRESYSIASAPEEGMENASGGNEEEVTESSDEVTNPVSPEEHAKLLNTPQPPIYPYDWESGKRHVSSGRLRGRRLFLRSDIEDVFGDSEASDLLEDFEPGLKNFLEIFVEGHPDEDINDSYIDPHADENALLPWGGSEVENEETIDVLDDFVDMLLVSGPATGEMAPNEIKY